MNKKEQKTIIEPEKWYSLSEMVEARLFPWCRNIATYRKYVLADRQANNYLKAIITGQGIQRKYRVKGKNIINYLVNVEDGTYQV